MAMLRIANVTLVLGQVVCAEGAPHTALVVDGRSGAVIASASSPPLAPFPFPRASLAERGDEERALVYAAVATSTWADERPLPLSAPATAPLRLEAELGRFDITRIGPFLVILVGSEVAPWSVLDKKVRLCATMLEPLATVV